MCGSTLLSKSTAVSMQVAFGGTIGVLARATSACHPKSGHFKMLPNLPEAADLNQGCGGAGNCDEWPGARRNRFVGCALAR
jgi:hypothetical protein